MTPPTPNAKTNAKVALDWLMRRNRRGLRRIETLTFARLNRIYRSRAATPAIRRAIRHECRRCGYTLAVLDINRWN
jgi:hypothetical protein